MMAEVPKVKPTYDWVTTSPNPRSPATGYDAGQRGWRLHLIDLNTLQRFTRHGPMRGVSLCGISARHGWSLDLFVDTPCERCENKAEKLGITTPRYPS